MDHLPGPDGTPLAVHDLGGSGRPALLCHATGLHGLVWAPLAAALGEGLRRWSMDFRAHGASVVPEGSPLGWDRFRDDVLAVVDGLDLPRGEVLGVGHSMGGAALLLAEQARPGTFAGLYLFEPITPPPGWFAGAGGPGTPNPMADGALRRRSSFPSAAEAIANFARKPPLGRLRADALAAYVDHGFVPDDDPDAAPGAVRLACRPEDEAQTFRGAADQQVFEHLREVACPVVVATGDEPVGPVRFAPAAADALPHGRLEAFDAIGHFGPLEAPDRVAAAVAAFAAGL